MRSLVLIAFCIGVASAASIAIPEIRSSASASASASVSTGGSTKSFFDSVTDFDSSTGSSASASASASASIGGSIDLTQTNVPCIEIDEPKVPEEPCITPTVVEPCITPTVVEQPCQVVSVSGSTITTCDGQTVDVTDESIGWKEISKEEAQSTPCAPGTFRRIITINPETGERKVRPAFELKKTLAPCVPCPPTVIYKPQVRRCYVPQTKCVPTYRTPCPPTYYRRPCPPTYRRPCVPTYRRPCPTIVRRPSRRYASACASSYVRRNPCVVQKTVVPAEPCAPAVIRIEKPAVQVSTQAVACAQATPEIIEVAPCETPEVKVPEIDCDLPDQITDLISKVGGGASASAFASASSSSSTSFSTQ